MFQRPDTATSDAAVGEGTVLHRPRTGRNSPGEPAEVIPIEPSGAMADGCRSALDLAALARSRMPRPAD